MTLQDATPIARQRILVTIIADHQIFDGTLAARFLATFTALLEDPEQLRDQD